MKEFGYCLHPFISINRSFILLNIHNIIKETKSYLSISEYGVNKSNFYIRVISMLKGCASV